MYVRAVEGRLQEQLEKKANIYKASEARSTQWGNGTIHRSLVSSVWPLASRDCDHVAM